MNQSLFRTFMFPSAGSGCHSEECNKSHQRVSQCWDEVDNTKIKQRVWGGEGGDFK